MSAYAVCLSFPDGSLRVDANVSVSPLGSDRLGTRSEVKNVSGVRFLARAVGEPQIRTSATHLHKCGNT